MGLFSDIFLSKQDKQVIDVYNSISQYWKNTNDFVVAHIRYIQDLNYRYKLDFSEKIITDLPHLILTPLLGNGLSQSNSMFIFSQFIVFYVFRKDNPKIYRYSDESLFCISENIIKILIPYKSRVTPEFSYQIDKTIDVIARFGNKNIISKKTNQNSNNREQSKMILASNIGCSPSDLKQKVFEQLDSMNATVEACKEVLLKHNNSRFEQAKQYKIHPDDTPANLMIEMIEEYIEQLKSKKKSDDQIFREMASSDSDLMAKLLTAQATGNMDRFNELIEQNPEFLEKFLKKMAENEDTETDEDYDDDLPF